MRRSAGLSARRNRISSVFAACAVPIWSPMAASSLVGLLTKDPKVVLEEGAQIVADPNQPLPMTMIGHVTSAYWSENCGRSIALALVAGGKAKIGQTLYVPMPDKTIAVEVSDMVFFDKEGGRING
jgi:sarcosine oxidase subunit alpha